MPGAGQSTGLDGYSADDVPMMQIGAPTVTSPHQVTTKPRQIPGEGVSGSDLGSGQSLDQEGPAALADPASSGTTPAELGETQPGGEGFDPSINGGDVQAQRDAAEDESTEDEQEDNTNFRTSRVNKLSYQVMRDNPGMSRDHAVRMVARALRIAESYAYAPGGSLEPWQHYTWDGALTQSLQQPKGFQGDRREREKQKGHRDRMPPSHTDSTPVDEDPREPEGPPHPGEDDESSPGRRRPSIPWKKKQRV